MLNSLLQNPLVLAIIIVIALLLLFIPIMLRLAGLSGQQIVDVISLSLEFFIALVKEIQENNKVGK